MTQHGHSRTRRPSSVRITVAGCFLSAASWAQCETAEFSGATVIGENFGRNVALAADVLVVGSEGGGGIFDGGKAWIYRLSDTGPVLEAELIGPNPMPTDWYGFSVDADGDRVVVGAPQRDDAGLNSGSVFTYVSNGAAWQLEAQLLGADTALGDDFGYSVALRGDTLVAGAVFDDDGGESTGSVYVFTWDGVSWSQQAKLLAPDAKPGDRFGQVVTLGEDVLVVTARNGDTPAAIDSGAVYVLRRQSSAWAFEAKLSMPDLIPGDRFGHALDTDGPRVVASTPFGRDPSADVFLWTGSAWVLEASLVPEDPEGTFGFGVSAALDGDTILVGASVSDGLLVESGTAYVFHRDLQGWSESAELYAADGKTFDGFGYSVDVEGDMGVIGAYFDSDVGTFAGSAYLFTGVAADPVWTGRGLMLPGSDGSPCMCGSGPLLAGEPRALSLRNAAPSSPTTLVIGLSYLAAPFKGGVLGPTPQLLLTGLVTDGSGELALAVTWPPGVPEGVDFYFQHWIVDATGPKGLAASNTLQATTPGI